VATVVFFISGHGFGHASREVEVINAFGQARPEARVLIRTAASPTLLARTLRVPHELRTGPLRYRHRADTASNTTMRQRFVRRSRSMRISRDGSTRRSRRSPATTSG
jgi:hypothetical protein